MQTLASHSDLAALARGHSEDSDLMRGWRWTLVGEELVDLLEGRIALSLNQGRARRRASGVARACFRGSVSALCRSAQRGTVLATGAALAQRLRTFRVKRRSAFGRGFACAKVYNCS